MHFMLTFDLLCCACGQSVQIVDRTASPVGGPHRPRGDADLAFSITGLQSRILVPPPASYSHIPFPTEYPDGFTTFTPSIATTPCPHTSVIAPPIVSSS
jgi:hypothetical protein